MSSYFVNEDSIVKKIWGKADTILFIFAGASAEFALNKSVDWLYFTGRLPTDPLGRLFSTVGYARQIIFSEHTAALQSIDKITAIHKGVEASRGASIPDEAYLEVLSMLIDYSIRSYELLEQKLTEAEKNDIFEVFYRVGYRMQLAGLPRTYTDWKILREEQLSNNLHCSHFTHDLFRQYKKHLGPVRYTVLKQAQVLVVPAEVNKMLALGKTHWLLPVLYAYKLCRILKMENLLKTAILPPAYITQIQALDVVSR